MSFNTSQRAVVRVLKAAHINETSTDVGSQDGWVEGEELFVVARALDFCFVLIACDVAELVEASYVTLSEKAAGEHSKKRVLWT